MANCCCYGTLINYIYADATKFLVLGNQTGHICYELSVSGILTTSYELVYGVKPDYRLLFCLFSTGYFKHSSDGSRCRDGITEATSMAGIAIGHCRKS